MNSEGSPTAIGSRGVEIGIKKRPSRNGPGTGGSLDCRFTGQCYGHFLLGQRSGYESAGAYPALEVTLGKKLRIRVQNRKAGDPKLVCKFTAGGNSLARTQFPTQDGGAESVINLLVQWTICFAVDGDCGQNSGGSSIHLTIIVASILRPLVDMAADHCGPDDEEV